MFVNLPGDACNYCHLPHSPGPKLDKRQRRIIEEMPKAHFLPLALELLADKARAMELQGTEALMGILENEVQSEDAPAAAAPAGVSGRPPLGLMRCLRAMGFRNLTNMAARKCAEGTKIRIRETVQALRANVSQGQAGARVTS